MKKHQRRFPPLQFILTTLTPVAIGGDGEGLSPYTDFVAERNKVMYIDPKKFLEELEYEAGTADSLVRQIRKGMDNNRSHFDLGKFIRREMQMDPEDLASQIYDVQDFHSGKKQHIQTIAKTGGRPFIPGSSLKGAFKTALLWDWLSNTEEGRSKLNDLSKKLSRMRPTRNRREARENIRTLEKFGSKLEQVLFGDMREDERTDANRLRFSDSRPFKQSQMQIYQTQRVHLLKDRKGIPIPTEAIVDGHETQFHLHLDLFGQEHFQHPFLNKFTTKHAWLQLIQCFALAFIPFEREQIQDSSEMEEVDYFYEGLEEGLKEMGRSYMRLGQGKTYYLNSIGLALRKSNVNAFKKLVSVMGLQKGKQPDFPITRVATVVDGYPIDPLGWVKVE